MEILYGRTFGGSMNQDLLCIILFLKINICVNLVVKVVFQKLELYLAPIVFSASFR